MGILISKVFDLFSSLGQKDCRLLLIGLDAAGKTTILYKLKLNEVVATIPTIGFNVETIQYKNLTMNIWDIGGQSKIRPLWRHYYSNCRAIIFVVDSADKDRLDEVRMELHSILNEDELRDCHLLILANKQDLPHAMSVCEMTHVLDLQKLHRKWFIQACTAVTGDGLYEGLDWLQKAC